MQNKEYIERGALISILDAKSDMAMGTPKAVFASVAKMVELLPAADVVEVVRCRDCVNSRPLNRNDRFEALYSDGCVYCMMLDEGKQADEFCSCGESEEQT